MNEESLFAAALELPTTADRQAVLDDACAGDACLRQRVEKLLAADENACRILDHVADAAVLAAEQLFAGRFRLCEKLGEGGMGEVWVADQQEPVQRRVALKVIRPGLDSARLLARFDQGRQALAPVGPPNIARGLGAGGGGGRPHVGMGA